MTHRLRKLPVLTPSVRHLLSGLFVLAGLLGYSQVLAQQTLDTQALSVTAICPGSQIDVPGIRTFGGGDFTVELSNNGGAYYEIPSSFLTASGRYEITYQATIPANTPAGTNYRVRLVAKNPAQAGTPSPTVLTVKAKPNAPTVDSVQLDCQRRIANDLYTNIYVGITPGASASLYNSNLSLNSNQVFNAATPATAYFQLSKPVAGSDEGYKYPISETTYFVTQTINGCESDKAQTTLRILYRPSGGPSPANLFTAYIGRLTYCQGDKALPLNVNGHSAPPENYQTGYTLQGANSGGIITTPPTPDTSVPNSQTYRLSLIPIDSRKGCRSAENPNGPFLIVDVNPRPGKPTVATNSITLCQSQSVSSLSATASEANTSLTWYGPNTTVGAGSSNPPELSTANVGMFRYYVAQKLNDCESERVEITVEVKPRPAAPGVQSVVACQNSPAQSLSATGQNLLWYTAENGGNGSATAPVVSTSQMNQATYHVSQSLNGCESSRSALSVTVNTTPGVPAVANTGPAYCQNAQAASLQADGQNLKWYRESSGGISLGSSVTPDTKEAGNFTYYVSQTSNGCEGSRSSLTVKVTASPSAPSVTNVYSYCQKATASALMATGNNLKWFEPSGSTTGTAPTPATDNPGTMSYFVTQSTDNCESPRSEIKVTVKSTPGAPGTSAISVCQNESTRALSANGQNLLWYSAESGGSGSATIPTLNTSQVGQVNYYVSQSQDGCESSRATLTVTIKSLPPAPGVTTKNICQFAPPESVSAMGERLTWYNVDGNKFGSAPTINTDKGASFSLLVSQTVNDCEGPKAMLTVNVLTTTAPTVSKTTVEICRGATAQPLEATGTNLKWTDPNGNVTPTTPTPPTVNATIKPEGDVYFVTQTGTNGCESPKVAIKVFVQTPPTLAISGTTTTNLGLEVPLKLMFTGVGPYQYKLSNGLSGTAIKDTTILVLPERTTIYQVTEVTNKCGTGLPGNGATATITVLIPTIQTLSFTTTTLCAGSSLSTNFLTSGAFNPGSVFKLQVAKVETDTAKIKFVDAVDSQTGNGQLMGTIPGNTPAGTYWVRVMATNPKIPINGSNSPTLLTVRALATAALTGNQTIYEGQPASLTVAFTGDGPWTFAYRDSTATGLGTSVTATATTNPHIVEVRPTKTTAYLLSSVSNGCGAGARIGNAAIITVAPLLGTDDQSLADAVEVYPVPATTTLTVQIKGLSATQPALLELTDLMGRTTLRQEVRQPTSSLTLDQQPSGMYLLRIRVGERTATKRVVKF